MFKLLLLFVVVIFLIGLYNIRKFFRGIFGLSSNNRQQTKQTKTSQKNRQPTASSSSKKIIASDEGEYVDYVEIKD